MYDIAGSGDFEWQNGQPGNGVFPRASKAPGRIDEPTNVHCKGAVDGVQDRHLGERLHHCVHLKTYASSVITSKFHGEQQTNDHEAEQNGSWTTIGERAGRADEEPCTDCTTTIVN